jgi:DNA-binding PadR family transcriptional regulator
MERLTSTKKRILTALFEVAPQELIAVEVGRQSHILSGSLYPALRALRNDGIVETRWEYPVEGTSESPRRLYRLSPTGFAIAKAIHDGKIVGTNWRVLLRGDRS